MDDQTANVLIGIVVVLIVILVWYLASRQKSDSSYVYIDGRQIDRNALDYPVHYRPLVDYSLPFYSTYGSRHYRPFRHHRRH